LTVTTAQEGLQADLRFPPPTIELALTIISDEFA
jgi:hypothetical protein